MGSMCELFEVCFLCSVYLEQSVTVYEHDDCTAGANHAIRCRMFSCNISALDGLRFLRIDPLCNMCDINLCMCVCAARWFMLGVCMCMCALHAGLCLVCALHAGCLYFFSMMCVRYTLVCASCLVCTAR